MSIIASNEFYEISTRNNIAIINIRDKVFDFITDVGLSTQLTDFIDSIDKNPDIKLLLFYNDPDSFSEEQYDKFIKRIIDKNKIPDEKPPYFSEKNVRFREINMLNTIIRHLADLQMIVIAAWQGTVVTPFIGAGLVADFRYAAKDTTLSMIHNKYGLHPSGGLPYFLSNFLHHSKAMEIQFSDKITAKEALDLGLITRILPKENFREHLITEVQMFLAIKYCTIRDTKRLTNFSRKSLNEYFDFEAGLLNL